MGMEEGLDEKFPSSFTEEEVPFADRQLIGLDQCITCELCSFSRVSVVM